MSAEPAIRVESLSVERDGETVLEDISFQVARGEFVGLCGPNGAGKTTLVKALLGLVPIAGGRVEVLGRVPRRAGGLGPGIGYVPQRQAIPVAFPARVGDVVAMGRLRARDGRPDAAVVDDALARVGIDALRERPVGRLSGGQQRRATLAQALCAGAELLILDEPTVGLDLPAEQAFYRLLRELQRDLGLTVVAVSHDLVALAGEADRLLCINRRLHVHGNPEDVVHSHALREAYSCEFDFLAGELHHHAAHGHGSEPRG